MNQTELEGALARGARLAVRRAYNWSAGDVWPGDTGAENLIQVSVADAIHRDARIKPAIHLEPTLARIDAQAFEGDTRRIDIGLMWKCAVGATPRYFSIVEIKKYPRSYEEDLRKLSDVLDQVDSVRHAYLVTYFQKYDVDRYAKKTLDDQIAKARDDIDAAARSSHQRACCHIPVVRLAHVRHDQGVWRAAALITRFDRD